MPTVTIDERQVTVDPGTSILEAAKKLGIFIPHYCYHPRLTIVDACRMCLVEVKGAPKLVTSCSNAVADNMVVFTDTPKVEEARQSVLEFLLINHPLDCPICDKSGECLLQNYYFCHSRKPSRFKENKVKKHKVVDLGPKIVLDSERCIVCTRCVRFCKEVAGEEILGIFNRADHSEIGVFPGKKLENNYQGNLADVCPVGALTARDFRFKCRSWFLCQIDTICPGCSNGCNAVVHFTLRNFNGLKGQRVFRLTPRENNDVNKVWLCDVGRWGYAFVDSIDRLTMPAMRKGEDFVKTDWNTALKETANRLKTLVERYGANAIGVIPSPHLTNEDLYALKCLFGCLLKIANIDFKVPGFDKGEDDKILLKADRHPNTKGAELLGLSGTGLSVEAMMDKVKAGEIKALYLAGSDPVKYMGEKAEEALSRAELVIFQGTNFNASCKLAHIVLPGATFVEKEGTFTNYQGRVQKVNKALEPLGEAMADWEIFTRLGQMLGVFPSYRSAEEVFMDIAREVAPFAGITYKKIGSQGIKLTLPEGPVLSEAKE
ncbi:MAG TPA: molybdopterin-dependent oxidoreductase [Candidatus Hypogeohydataceae bacterium YC41]